VSDALENQPVADDPEGWLKSPFGTSDPSSASPEAGAHDDAGMSDDGRLDDATLQLLLTAHGV
jgi:hypothetical protein